MSVLAFKPQIRRYLVTAARQNKRIYPWQDFDTKEEAEGLLQKWINMGLTVHVIDLHEKLREDSREIVDWDVMEEQLGDDVVIGVVHAFSVASARRRADSIYDPDGERDIWIRRSKV